MALGSELAPFFGAAGAAGGAATERSLRFSQNDSSYLNRNVTTAGNQRTWTLSLWLKRSKLYNTGSYQQLFTADIAGNQGFIYFDSIDQLVVYDGNPGGSTVEANSVSMRDPSAWYHVVIKYDTTQITPTDRLFIYLNGEDITKKSATFPQQDHQGPWNYATSNHLIATRNGTQQFFDGYLADIHFIDGQALTPTSFGEFDATTGVWNPIAYTGTFPGNSFHLDFADNSSAAALGTDTSGNGNDWTVNNLTVASSSPGVKFDGYLDYVTVASSTDFEFGSGDFTVEFFTLTTGHPGTTTWISRDNWDGGAGGAPWVIYYASGNIYFSVTETAGSWAISGAGGVSYSNNVLHHVAFVRNGNSFDLYLDGVKGTTGTFSGSIEASSNPLLIGAYNLGYNGGVNGYISNIRIVKGTALYTTNFTPPTEPLTSVTNTKLLCFQSSTSVTDAAVTPGTITAFGNVYATYIFGPSSIDSLRDSPTNGNPANDTGAGGEIPGNYCTWNPLANPSQVTLSQGNLNISAGAGSPSTYSSNSTIGVSDGKWYWEATAITAGTNSNLGISKSGRTDIGAGTGTGGYAWQAETATKVVEGSYTSGYGSAATGGSVVMFALDMTNLKFYVGKDGTWFDSGDPVTGTNPLANISAGTYFATARPYDSSVTCEWAFNWGQRAFSHSAPSGFKALCTANLNDPLIADPSTLMDVATYPGTGSSQTITLPGAGFDPDFIWIKRRNLDANHVLYDAVRGFGTGATKTLYSDLPNTEDTTSVITSTTSTGFNLSGSGSETNASGGTYVAWTWDAGSSTVTNTDGTITGGSQVRANSTAGFSILTYSAGTSGSTVGHGLGVSPHLIIAKSRTVSGDWVVYHSALGNNLYLLLSQDAIPGSLAGYWGTVGPSTFGVSNNGFLNNTGDMVAYCFAPVEAYSAFGSYVGNGSSTAGPFVSCGFRPAFVLVKNITGVGEWVITDNKRDGYNQRNPGLSANRNFSEGTIGNITYLNMNSNGFNLVSNSSEVNDTGSTYIYAAFAENPFKYARAR